MGIFDKAKDALGDHGDTVDKGIDRAGDMADDKTGGKYTEQIDRGEDMAGDYLTPGDSAADVTQPPTVVEPDPK
jgi:hypothetical protein